MLSFNYLIIPLFTLTYIEISESTDDRCWEEINSCIIKKLSYQKLLSMETLCCVKGFSEGFYSYETQEKCVKENSREVMLECLNTTGCHFPPNPQASKKKSKIEDFRKDVRIEVGEPKNKEQCPNYAIDCKEEALTRCINLDDEQLKGSCNLLEQIMENSPIYRDVCINLYGQCLVDRVPKKALRDGCSIRINNLQTPACLEPPLLPKRCSSHVLNYTENNFRSWNGLMKTVEGLAGKSTDRENCELYQKSVEEQLIKLCSSNKNSDLFWFCDVTTSIISQPFANE